MTVEQLLQDGSSTLPGGFTCPCSSTDAYTASMVEQQQQDEGSNPSSPARLPRSKQQLILWGGSSDGVAYQRPEQPADNWQVEGSSPSLPSAGTTRMSSLMMLALCRLSMVKLLSNGKDEGSNPSQGLTCPDSLTVVPDTTRGKHPGQRDGGSNPSSSVAVHTRGDSNIVRSTISAGRAPEVIIREIEGSSPSLPAVVSHMGRALQGVLPARANSLTGVKQLSVIDRRQDGGSNPSSPAGMSSLSIALAVIVEERLSALALANRPIVSSQLRKSGSSNLPGGFTCPCSLIGGMVPQVEHSLTGGGGSNPSSSVVVPTWGDSSDGVVHPRPERSATGWQVGGSSPSLPASLPERKELCQP